MEVLVLLGLMEIQQNVGLEVAEVERVTMKQVALEEAADRLGLNRSRVQAMLTAGIIDPAHIERHGRNIVLIDADYVEALRNRRQHNLTLIKQGKLTVNDINKEI